jgi:P27 family predicted phage terminase small subunit
MPGPPRKPNEIKVLEGNPGKRRIPVSPKPERVLGLKCPSFIGKHGRQEWNRITPELAKLGMLTRIDQVALEMYCRTYQKWRDAEEFLIEKGTYFVLREPSQMIDGKEVEGNIRYMQQMPQVSIAQQCAEYCRKMIQEFGLSPAARSRLEIKPREVATKDVEAFASTLD